MTFVRGNKHEKAKMIYGRKRKWPKPLKIVIFRSENENKFRSAFISYDYEQI